jgi:hypothetical protein
MARSVPSLAERLVYNGRSNSIRQFQQLDLSLGRGQNRAQLIGHATVNCHHVPAFLVDRLVEDLALLDRDVASECGTAVVAVRSQ